MQDFDKTKKKYTVTIFVIGVLWVVLWIASAFIFAFSSVKQTAESFESVLPEVVESEDVVTEDLAVFTETVIEDEEPVEVVTYEEPVVLNEEAEGYDYSTDTTDSFGTSYVVTDELIEASEEPTVILDDLRYSLDVNWNTLCSNETYEAIYENVQKDESFDTAKQTRCLNKIASSMKMAQEYMATAEGTTAKIEYDFYTSATELMLELRVLDTLDNVCYNDYFGLGVTSNEVD